MTTLRAAFTAASCIPEACDGGIALITRFDASRSFGSDGWIDVLVHAEQIIRVVLLLYRDQPIVVCAVARFDTGLALIVRHEVHVSAAEIVGVYAFPVGLRPALQRA